MAASEGKSDLPRWHRVCLNTIVRKGMALDSERLRILPMGSKVWVVEQQERRVRIDRPIVGWCSLKSSNGDTILTPLEKTVEEEASQTPSSAANLEENAEEAEKNYDAAAGKLATAAMNVGDGIDQQKREEMMQMVANGELGQLQGQLDALKTQYEAEQTKNAQDLEEFENAIKEARDAKLHADSVKALAEAKMRELNILKNQFVEMFTKMEGDEEKKKGSTDVRPISDGGVLLLHTSDIVVCRFQGEIAESGEPGEWLGVLYDQPFGNSDGRFKKGDDFGEEYLMERCQMGFGKFIRETEIKKRLFADQLLHRLSNAMNLYVQNQSVVEGAQMVAEN